MMPLLIPAGNASPWTGPTGNNTWLLRGRVPTLVDAGIGGRDHLLAVSSALEDEPLAQVLITHGHVDHASGVPAIRARWPDVRIRRFGDADGFGDGDRIAAGDVEVTVLYTPGHSPDHCCFANEATGDLFCGDLVRLGNSIVIPASKGGDVALYLESLRRVRALNPARLLPGHGPIIHRPEDAIDQFIRHRLERDAQILDALSEGCRTARDITQRIYRGIPERLIPAAEDTLLAHLIKLRDEGRVAEVEGGWRLA